MELSTNVSSIWWDNKKRYISISDINSVPSKQEDKEFEEKFGVLLSALLEGLEKIKDYGLQNNCLRRNYIAAGYDKFNDYWELGYNHNPVGEQNCKDIGKCKREELNIPQGQCYELCRSIHAEQSLLLKMSENSRFNSIMILIGKDAKTGEYIDSYPCIICKKMLKESTFKYLFCQTAKENVFEIIDIDNWK